MNYIKSLLAGIAMAPIGFSLCATRIGHMSKGAKVQNTAALNNATHYKVNTQQEFDHNGKQVFEGENLNNVEKYLSLGRP